MKISNRSLLFKKNRWLNFIRMCIFVVLLVFLAPFLFSPDLQTKHFYWLCFLVSQLALGVVILTLEMLPCFSYIKVNQKGLTIKRFFSTTINWADIRHINLIFNSTWFFSYLLFEYGNHFNFKMIGVPNIKKVPLYHFYLFLTKARTLIKAGEISSNLELKDLFQNIKKEQEQDIKQVYQWVQVGHVNHLSKHTFFMIGLSYSILLIGMLVLNLAPFFNSKALFFSFSHLVCLSIYLIVLFTMALGIRKVVIYNTNTHALYTGISLLGKLILLRQVMTDVKMIDIKDTTWGRVHFYQVIFNDQNYQLPCRFFLTYAAAKRFRWRLAQQLKLQIKDSYINTTSVIMRLIMTTFDYIVLAISLVLLIGLTLIYFAVPLSRLIGK